MDKQEYYEKAFADKPDLLTAIKEADKEYEAIKKQDEAASKLDKVLDGISALLKKATPSVPVRKHVEEEQRLATFVVLAPDEEDLHGDIYDAATVEKACHNFNVHCGIANLLHKVETEKALIVESFISLSDYETEEGVLIKAGTWLQKWHFPEGDEESETLWSLVKEGELNGLSVGCKADIEELDNA